MKGVSGLTETVFVAKTNYVKVYAFFFFVWLKTVASGERSYFVSRGSQNILYELDYSMCVLYSSDLSVNLWCTTKRIQTLPVPIYLPQNF